MSHTFKLTPNIKLLKSTGYLIPKHVRHLNTEFRNRGYVEVEEVDTWTEKQKQSKHEAFAALLKENLIFEHYDTLFYACLLEFNAVKKGLEQIKNTYSERCRDKELAQLLMLYHADGTLSPSEIIVSMKGKKVKLTHPHFISMLRFTIKNMLESGSFNPRYGFSLFKFILMDDGSVPAFPAKLNYKHIQQMATGKIRKPGKREENSAVARALLKIWNILVKGNVMVNSEVGIFSNQQLNFLYQLGEMFALINNPEQKSLNKDYMSALLYNEFKRK